MDKKERKRKRKEERRRREREENLIHIETMQPSFMQEPVNPSVISIATMQAEPSNMIQLDSMMADKPKKHKKTKKPKEAGSDIVIDTQMPASMVSIANPYNYMPVPAFVNQISLPVYSLPSAAFFPEVISIPIENQPDMMLNEVVLTIDESRKRKQR